MRKAFFITVAVVCLSCATTRPSPEATIGNLEEVWNQSRIARDAVRVASLLADDWTLIHVDGRREGKGTYVHDIATGGRQIQFIEVKDRTIRVFGRVAVVTGEAVGRGYRRGEMREGRLRFTHIWVFQNQWRMILSQSTEIKTE